MRQNRDQEIEEETDTRCHTKSQPPDAQNQTYGSRNLTSCQKWKALHRHAHSLVDYLHYMRVVTQLPDSRKQHHRREQYRDHERCNFHISTPSSRGKYHTAGLVDEDEAVF